MHPRHLALAAVILTAISGCSGTSTTDVGPVTLEVPSGWTVDDRLATDDAAIQEQRHWRSDDGTATLQVIVGCGDGDATDLREGIAQAYQVRDELPAEDVEVAGLQTAQRASLTLASDPTGSLEGRFHLDGLYGAGSGGLVVVQLGATSDEHDPSLVEATLGSVAVDEEELAAGCAADG